MTSIISRRELFRVLGAGAALIGIGVASAIAASGSVSSVASSHSAAATETELDRGVVAEPTRIPPPITGRSRPIHHEVTFDAREVSSGEALSSVLSGPHRAAEDAGRARISINPL